MAFQLTAAKINAIEYVKAVSPRYRQVVELDFTMAATDVSMDIGALLTGSLGTFWTAATGDATYGTTVGLTTLAALQQIAKVGTFLGTLGGFTTLRSPIGTATGTTDYQMTVANNAPTFTFATGDAPSVAQTLFLSYDMPYGWVPMQIDYPVAVAAYTAP